MAREMARQGGRSRSSAKLAAVQKNLIKAHAVRAARRNSSNASPASASNVSPEAPSVIGGAPVVGKKYVRRDGCYMEARPGPSECIYTFDGENFLASGLG
jgi:hypothetical protein